MAQRPVPPSVMVIGDVIDDVVVHPLGPMAHGSDTPARIEPSAGGSGANQAAWMARHGATVRFVGRVGAADADRHRQALSMHGAEPHLARDHDHPTGRIVVLLDERGERSMFTDRGANRYLTAADVPHGLLDDVDHVHVSGYCFFEEQVREVVLATLAYAAARGVGWSVDPASVAFLEMVGPATFLRWLDGCVAMFPNLDEGRLLTGARDAATVVDRLLVHVPLVALTLGADGVLVAHRDGRRLAVEAPSRDVTDTTGAGDAFCGAFVATWLLTGDLGQAAQLGVESASTCVTRPGGRPQLPGGAATAG